VIIQVGLPKAISQNRPGIFRRIIQALNPSPETIVKRARDVQEAPYLFEGIFDLQLKHYNLEHQRKKQLFMKNFQNLNFQKQKQKLLKNLNQN
jgi:hypothetical protein